jgi:hypothetical protein
MERYTEIAMTYAAHLKANENALRTLLMRFDEKGKSYFGRWYTPVIPEDNSEDEDDDEGIEISDFQDILVLKKAQFAARLREAQGEDAEINEASFDDAYRHTIFLNVSDMDHPTLVDAPQGLLHDYVLHWSDVDRLPALLPEGVIAAHLDGLTDIMIPIPTRPTSKTCAKAHR